MPRPQVHDLEVIFQHATERAVCVRAAEDTEDVWLPLSLVEIEPRDGGALLRGCVAVLTAPERVLTEKGLL